MNIRRFHANPYLTEISTCKGHTIPKIRSLAPSWNMRQAPKWTSSVCLKLGISSGTFYNWRSKYTGLEVNEAKRLRELETENNRLKKLLADKLLEVEAMKDVLSKKW